MLSRAVGLLLLLVVLVPARTEAGLINFVDTFDPADVLFRHGGGECVGSNGAIDSVSNLDGNPERCISLLFTHALTGYSSPPDTLLSAVLTLYLYDDDHPNTDATVITETFDLTLDGTLVEDNGTVTSGSTAGSPFAPTYNAAFQVQPDGLLTVLLSLDQGDFYFARSVLDASWDDNPATTAAAPEPAALAMFGVALLAASSKLRRRTRAQN